MPTYAHQDPRTGAFDPGHLRRGFVLADRGPDSYGTAVLRPLSQDLAAGTVMGRTAEGMVPLDIDATDGSQVAVALLIRPASKRAPLPMCVEFLTGHARVSGGHIVWPAGATAEQVASGIGQLRAAGIVVV